MEEKRKTRLMVVARVTWKRQRTGPVALVPGWPWWTLPAAEVEAKRVSGGATSAGAVELSAVVCGAGHVPAAHRCRRRRRPGALSSDRDPTDRRTREEPLGNGFKDSPARRKEERPQSSRRRRSFRAMEDRNKPGLSDLIDRVRQDQILMDQR